MKAFKISEIQTNAILEIRLRQLAKLEQIKLEEEKGQLELERAELEKIIKSKARLKTYIKTELKEIKDNFGDPRNSPIEALSEAKAFSEEEMVTSEAVTIVLSKGGWIRSAKGHDLDPSTLTFRGDDSLQHFAKGRNNQSAIFFDSGGKAFSLAAHSLPSARGMGEPLTGRVSSESGVTFMGTAIGAESSKILIANSAGYGFVSELSNALSNQKKGKAFMKLPEKAELLPPLPLNDSHRHVVAISSIGRMLIFDISELPMLPKGKGNKIINIPKPKLLAGEESMNFICLLSDASTLQIHSGKRFMSLKLKDLENYISTRAKRGMMLPQGYRKVDSVIEINAEDEVAPE
jgi:topoisomerase-4 subunit A